MKIAVMYSGLLDRNFFGYYQNHIKHIYNYYDTDIFISTYLDVNDAQNTLENLTKKIDIKNISIKSYQETYPHLHQIKTRFISEYRKDCRPINALSMFYNIKCGFDIINDPNNYDIIIRNRFDILYNQKLDIEKNELLNVPAGGDYHGGLMDLFAYGNPFIMKQYCGLYDNIENYAQKVIFHPESILRHHCNSVGIPIKRFRYDIFLRGLNFTRSAPCYE